MRPIWNWTLGVLLTFALMVLADEEHKAASPPGKSVEQITALARQSVVVIKHAGRDGKQAGLGTGFVVDADGLIATNLHVLGEARPITVESADGKPYEVISVHASDRARDLALLRVAAKGLPALELGNSDQLKEGQSVVALGNPAGLTYSVVSGVVSGKREIDGRPMIQLAIPVEPGNSGGPILDLSGRVQGILTMKSAVTRNLGFAVPINELQPLLKKPNPIPMSRWLTIGQLDPAEWTVLFDARWRQRGAKILAEGFGTGFGGRSLCLSQQPVPEPPYELAVTVRLDDEAGAAGLVFQADGRDKHYGFYPSAGQLRLTRFDGPDVYSWKILKQEPSPHYRPGEWNALKVHVDKDKIRCYVNDQLVMEEAAQGLGGGRVGLAKFRATRPEFKHFQVGKKIHSQTLPAEIVNRISKSIDALAPSEPPTSELLDTLLPDAAASVEVLRNRAKLLEQQAARLRTLASAVHQKHIQTELAHALQRQEDDIDLFGAALLIAKLDNEEVDLPVYRKELERMAREVNASLPTAADEADKLGALNKYLFTERGFHGSRGDYYNRANSYLNEVIDDREGLPITLSVLYMELAHRLGMRMAGIGLPGHFIVEHRPAKGKPQWIDVYDGGRTLSREEAAQIVQKITGEELREEDLRPVGKKAILVRMLHNLLGLTRADGDIDGALRYLDTILVIAPEAGNERLLRAAARLQTGNKAGARQDVDWLLEHEPEGVSRERVLELRRLLSDR
ncbi:MAG TPA: transglutaminase family protein [Gemmataceae bacterium]|nr:transglutaminase family protein [Gemmataceae bacterium]